jgi:hypothetical protein
MVCYKGSSSDDDFLRNQDAVCRTNSSSDDDFLRNQDAVLPVVDLETKLTYDELYAIVSIK